MFHDAKLTLSEDSLHTLDPTLVVSRLQRELSRVVICNHDYAWKDYDSFRSRSDVAERAIRVAESDARRRGPIWVFRIYSESFVVAGAVERRRCMIYRKGGTLPEGLKQEFLAFLRSLEIPGARITTS